MVTYSERTLVIADIIERYVKDHPRAADTPEGIRSWWVAPQHYGDSLEDVQMALDYLIELGRMARTALPDGAVLYARAGSRNGKDQE
jgi:hypothetical protein